MSFPKLVKVHITTVKKPQTEIDADHEYLRSTFQTVSRFGGDHIEGKEVNYEPFKKLLAEEPEKLTPFQSLFKDELGVAELHSLEALLHKVLSLSKTGEKMRTFSTMDFGFPVEYVDTEEKLSRACAQIAAHRVICFDVEFTDLESQDLPKDSQHSIRSICASV